MKYRAEIDGLRCLAVVPVILYHAGFELFSGGFLGVDVFFVISGYLITKIIYEQLIKGSFSFIKFYDKRIRRIIPPLLITAFLTISIAYTFSPADIKNVGQSLVATFTFLSNYFFYLEIDYFNPFNQSAPLLHTWSLSVEEQFYILLPITLYLFARKSSKYLILLFMTLFSFYGAIQLTEINPNLSFYSIHTRGWELLIGTMLAIYETDKKNKLFFKSNLVAEIFASVAICLLFLSFILFDENTKHPYWPTVIPVLSTAALIYFSQHTHFIKSFLSNRLLVGVGLISYALYLFHNPIFSTITYHSNPDDAMLYKFLSLPIIIFMAYISYRFIEKPARDTNFLKGSLIHPVLLFLMIATLTMGYSAHRSDGFLAYFKTQLIEAGGVPLVDVEAEMISLQSYRSKYQAADAPYQCGNGYQCTNILIVGDSFAEDAYLALSSLENPKISVRKISFDDECMENIIFYKEVYCRGDTVSFELANTADVIIVTAKWQESTYEGGVNFSKSLKKYTGKPVYVTGSVMFEDLSSFSFKTEGLEGDDNAISRLAYSNMRFDRLRISDKLKIIVSDDDELNWIEKSDFFCLHNKKTCQLFKSGKALIWDNAHLTSRAYLPYGTFLLGLISKDLN